MKLEILPRPMTVCKLLRLEDFDLSGLYFIGNTGAELSLVCETERTPARTLAREDGWRALRIAGTLDFSLTGILSGIASILAEEKIGIFAVSTYDTDYILVKRENLDRAVEALRREGYELSLTRKA
ncbi:MAG: ACT domain-containing protein [Clostridia bacterium]|nr:ACT domain-containing protein [Clostridia bacterium]MBR6890000.1 ACT domain-containing protein [Clostridia bacterium]